LPSNSSLLSNAACWTKWRACGTTNARHGGGAAAIDDSAPAPAILVHSLAQAVAALTAAYRAGRPVVLASAPDAGGYAGPGWFGGLIAAARASVPEAHA